MCFRHLVIVVLTCCIIQRSHQELFRNPKTRVLLDLLTDSEKLFLFGTDSDPEYHVANFKHNNRRKRQSSDSSRLSDDLEVMKENLKLKLQPSIDLIDPKFLMTRRWENRSEIVMDLPLEDVDNCFYRGDNAALYMCGDVRGIVSNDRNSYFIHPLPERFHNTNSIMHVIVRKPYNNIVKYNNQQTEEPVTTWNKHRRKPINIEESVIATSERDRIEIFKSNINDNYTQPIIEQISYTKSINSRKKRSLNNAIKSPIFVETAVFVDRDLFKHMTVNYPKDTERELVRFVLAMINAVQLLYHDPSLGRAVNFILKRLEILHEDPSNLKRPHDIDRFLSNFCTWQRLENPHGDSDPLHWDHALILTGLDLYVVSKNGKVSSQVVGLAPVAGMCTITSSCTVNEGRHFESVYVVAHEIGHNLGMRHDGPLADNSCDPSSFIMSPTLGSGKITWSQCSQNYLQKFLDTVQSRCLLDHSSSAGQLDHSAEAILPGERFDADQQCMLKYGHGSKHAGSQSLDAICRDLHCQRERYTWTSHPALEGTACGNNSWCRSGACVQRMMLSDTELNASSNWSEWSNWSECASGCLYSTDGILTTGSTGITVSSRKCNKYRSNESTYSCSGDDKRYQTCFAHQCQTVPRMTIKEFADEICTRAREVDPDLTGVGMQRIDENVAGSYVESGCAVWCSAVDGSWRSRGWSLPDGTACSTTTRDTMLSSNTAHQRYCVSGKCQKFTCSAAADAQFTLRPSECEPEILSNSVEGIGGMKEQQRVKPGDGDVEGRSGTWRRAATHWRPLSGCNYRCIRGGAGLRLVSPTGQSSSNHEPKQTIQLCSPDRRMADMGCPTRSSANQYASIVCNKYKERVRRLSGLGMQITPSLEDPDRGCRVACQDMNARQRFYLVNGADGWLPYGTPCAHRAYCVSGRCLEFGVDNTPVTEIIFTLPLHSSTNNTTQYNGRSIQQPFRTSRDIRINNNTRPNRIIRSEHRNIHITEYIGDRILNRKKRSLQRDKASSRVKATLNQQHLDDIIAKLNFSESVTKENSISEATIMLPDKLSIDFSNPIHV